MQSDNIHAKTKHPAKILWQLIHPDRSFFKVAIIYSLAISLLTLAVPIAVQTMVNTLVNIASLRAVIILASILFLTLAASASLSALRTKTMEYFERRIYARLSAEVSLHTIYAKHEFFAGRRNTDITNRYFEIIILQKNIPFLLVDGFALLMQLVVGFTLVSFYHPILLVFNAIIIFTVYLFWKFWGASATRTAVKLSHSKYEMSKWLDSLAYAHEFFKSTRHINYALERTDQLTSEYVNSHKNHFKYTFSQTVAFLMLYAIASSVLLGLGGWLVIIGKLSLGQLIAAELILVAILFGLSKATEYLKFYYEMCGAADELNQVLNIPQENSQHNNNKHIQNTGNALVFEKVVTQYNNNDYYFNFNLPENAKVLIDADKISLHYAAIHLLKQNIQPHRGSIQLAGNDLSDFNAYQLRQDVIVIDRSPIVECTIEAYLRMSKPDASSSEMRTVLNQVNILDDIEKLPQQLQTLLSPLGDPLSPGSFLQLKLAAALLTKPKVIVLTQFFVLLSSESLNKLFAFMQNLPLTVLYFANKEQSPYFSHRLILDEQDQSLLKNTCYENSSYNTTQPNANSSDETGH